MTDDLSREAMTMVKRNGGVVLRQLTYQYVESLGSVPSKDVFEDIPNDK